MSHKYLLCTCEAQASVQVLEFSENKRGGRVLLSTELDDRQNELRLKASVGRRQGKSMGRGELE